MTWAPTNFVKDPIANALLNIAQELAELSSSGDRVATELREVADRIGHAETYSLAEAVTLAFGDGGRK